MNRYFIFISFKGTSYHGWQIQPNSITVQSTIEESLSLILGEKVRTTGAGRTDTGVHALVFCAHFDSKALNLDKNERLIYRLNRFLPSDISVSAIRKVIPDANARFSAKSRTYKYYICRRKDPFTDDSGWLFQGKLDVDMMNKACSVLFKHSDFKSFSRLHSDNKTSICRVFQAIWVPEGDKLVFTIRADRFLRNMVRAIVGTMMEIGQGKMSLKEFEEVIIAKDRAAAGTSAPAKGLFLTEIEYPEDIFLPCSVKN
ncbi:MAG: tRNA pseudouridine(38-40) synthase TruA [Bacteroidota bacterium]|nr:tRNA pseudouridine(38-40) synthase TruA [Bacteroidota bacterium]